jgi:hypothetical protein
MKTICSLMYLITGNRKWLSRRLALITKGF